MSNEWLEGMRERNQKLHDSVYPNQVESWKQACKDWITANLINRDIGQPISPVPAKPTKWEFYIEDGELKQQAVVDYTLIDPVLPEPLPVVPSKPLETKAGESHDLLVETHTMVKAIHNMLFGSK